MLSERVFFIGAYVTLASGVAWIAFLIVDGVAGELFIVLYPGAFFLLFGGIFLYTALGARRERRALLALGERSGTTTPSEPRSPR